MPLMLKVIKNLLMVFVFIPLCLILYLGIQAGVVWLIIYGFISTGHFIESHYTYFPLSTLGKCGEYSIHISNCGKFSDGSNLGGYEWVYAFCIWFVIFLAIYITAATIKEHRIKP